MNQSNRNILSRHGHVFSPASRAFFAMQSGKIGAWQMNQCEAGKFFPEVQAGITDSYAPGDTPSNFPPPDGKIASANQPGMGVLDATGTDWQKHDVKSNDFFEVSWGFTANHRTRRFNYFITKSDWDPNKELSRSQFENHPFYTSQYNQQPFWNYTTELMPTTPTTHSFHLPNRTGYHVLLAVWEVADTGNAFYQVIDLNFVSDGSAGTTRPTTPTGLKIIDTTDSSVSLSWNANPLTDPYLVTHYRLVRNGITIIDIPSSQLTWTDYSVQEGETYEYFIYAIDINDNISLPSTSIQVVIPPSSGVLPPSAPQNLHAMSILSNSVDLMWGLQYLQIRLSNIMFIEMVLIFQ